MTDDSGLRLHHGRWQVRYRDRAGRQRAATFERKTDAKRFRDEVRVDKRRGVWVDPARGRERFGDYAEAWFASTAHLVELASARHAARARAAGTTSPGRGSS